MKKILLGITALSSIASFGAKYEHLHGYLELEGSVSTTKPITYENVNGGGSSPAPAANTSNEMKIKELWDQKD
ncbi:hypothetical protein, partial [Streptobacillus ratti]|uniref:hypothetical protein n=1 Tax=Streptobacillus ratti TaxID=1720557 RepID=UPI0039E73D9E